MPRLDVQIRPFTHQDLEPALRIERACFGDPWGTPQFSAALRTDGASMRVAIRQRMLVGYIVMRVWPHHVEIWNLAVEPESQRQGVGAQLVGQAKARLIAECRDLIQADVRETNLAGQLFFRSQCFVAMGIEKTPYLLDPAIHFEYSLAPRSALRLRAA